MRLCTFEVSTSVGRHWRLGAVTGHGIIDLNFACAWHLHRKGEARPYALANVLVPDSMLEYLRGEKTSAAFAVATLESIASALSSGESAAGLNGETLVYQPDDVRLRPPLPHPTSFRDIDAFEAHAKKELETRDDSMQQKWCEIPVYSKGGSRNIIGPEDDVPWPPFTDRFDYEPEVGVVIGRKGTNITAGDARAYIAGYTILNDFSVRDITPKEMRVSLAPAKGKDWATAIGPLLVTPDEIGDPYTLRMQARVNGEPWFDGNTGTMPWRFERMMEFLSRDENLHPGDLIGSGTVSGGRGMELGRRVMPGDTIELEIEKIGVLRNRVVRRG